MNKEKKYCKEVGLACTTHPYLCCVHCEDYNKCKHNLRCGTNHLGRTTKKCRKSMTECEKENCVTLQEITFSVLFWSFGKDPYE